MFNVDDMLMTVNSPYFISTPYYLNEIGIKHLDGFGATPFITPSFNVYAMHREEIVICKICKGSCAVNKSEIQ